MELRPKKGKGAAGRYRLEGELTIYTANDDREALLKALDGPDELEWNLAGITEMDTAGAQLLVLAKREAAAGTKTLVFTEHSAAAVEAIELLNLAGHLGDPLVLTGKEKTT